MKLDHLLTSYTTINSKLMKELNVRKEIIKILGRTQAVTSLTLAIAILLCQFPEAMETKAKINYWDFIKIKPAQ